MSKIGIVVCCYNRNQYTRRCFESLRNADIPKGTLIVLVDDASTEPEAVRLFNEFYMPDVEIMRVRNTSNKSIKYSLLVGFQMCFDNGCRYVTNLDNDAIVRRDFLSVLLSLHEKFPYNIATGFNCTTKNRDGSVRHKIMAEDVGWNAKASVGGINMFFNRVAYDQWIEPALIVCLEKGGNWDHQSCLRSQAHGRPIVCTVPSVVQHIGVESSMGHSAGGEPPDVADDFIMDYKHVWDLNLVSGDAVQNAIANDKLRLLNVTLVGADCVNIDRLIRAANISCENIEFGEVLLFSSLAKVDSRVNYIRPLRDKGDYSDFMMKQLGKYIKTDYLLVIQYDGFVLNPAAWRDEWLQYDYIGAPWEWYRDGMNVGNGGFSLRSKRLQDILMNDPAIIPINEPGVTKWKEEDHCICRLYRSYLENTYKIKYAPIEEARMFSIEAWNAPSRTWNGQFGFHGHTADISNSGYKI